jgi:hypothetical protein
MSQLYRTLTDSSGPPKIEEPALPRPTVSVVRIIRECSTFHWGPIVWTSSREFLLSCQHSANFAKVEKGRDWDFSSCLSAW